MEGFTKREKEHEEVAKNEIRVSNKQRKIQSYISYATKLLVDEKVDKIVIKATGAAIVKAHILIEQVKRQVGDLHQQTEICTFEMVDIYDPKIEGLEVIEQKRFTQQIICTLSREAIDVNHYGYQVPQPKDDRPADLPHKRLTKKPREQKREPKP
jgi:ribonuclease P/MRP protein subunit RPP25